MELSAKCNIIFESHQDVVNQMPEVQDKNIHDLKYAGILIKIVFTVIFILIYNQFYLPQVGMQLKVLSPEPDFE